MLWVELPFQRQNFRLQCLTGPLPLFQPHPVFSTDLPTGGRNPAVKLRDARILPQKSGVQDTNPKMAEDGNILHRQPVQVVFQGFGGELGILGNGESRLR